jgi:suppressor of ftsI
MPVTRQRRLVYNENDEGTKFYLNDKQLDMERIDAEVKFGDVEEWTLVNDSDERHTFHIHQVEFLVQSETKKPGVVKVKIPFTSPVIVGKFPYHGHILEHEDGA